MKQSFTAVLFIAATVAGNPTWGHGDASGKKTARPATLSMEEKPFGKPGDPKRATRTIKIDMVDTMHFLPGNLRVKQGETIRFVVANKGKTMHEMVIGTMKELKEHAELMKKFPDMEHDEPYMAHVAPGRTETIIWQFSKAGDFHYACLIAGHMEAGMVNRITVSAK